MKLESVSVEIIKPSKPTPPHLKSLDFSIFDQHTPHAFYSLPIFFSNSSNSLDHTTKFDQICHHLKTSLSDTLTRFYPFAGRIKDDYKIDCNDEGVHFLIARVHQPSSLSQALAHIDSDELKQLFPSHHTKGNQLLGIQVNLFNCGGIALCVYLSHKIADARSLCTFVVGWASVARSDYEVVVPNFDLPSVFPPIQVPPNLPVTQILEERVVTKVFFFYSSSISALKSKSTSKTNDKIIKYPSKVMALTAFLWTILMKMGGKRPSTMAIAVNVRRRIEPQMHEHSMGNIAIPPLTPPLPPISDFEAELPRLVKVLEESVTSLFEKNDVVKKNDGNEYVKIMDCYMDSEEERIKGELGFYNVSSWLYFPFYEADFGFGKPTWVACLNCVFRDVFVYMDGKNGEGVEVWASLSEEDMAKFESMPELLQFCTPMTNIIA